MNRNKVLYAISVEDVIDAAEENDISFADKDIPFIEGKIGDFMGDKWCDAVDYALCELKNSRANSKKRGKQT